MTKSDQWYKPSELRAGMKVKISAEYAAANGDYNNKDIYELLTIKNKNTPGIGTYFIINIKDSRGEKKELEPINDNGCAFFTRAIPIPVFVSIVSLAEEKPNQATYQIRCHRCAISEKIPTYQFVKFDLQIHYLCYNCWQTFRRWFLAGENTHKER